jgi:hypothetical protein
LKCARIRLAIWTNFSAARLRSVDPSKAGVPLSQLSDAFTSLRLEMADALTWNHLSLHMFFTERETITNDQT